MRPVNGWISQSLKPHASSRGTCNFPKGDSDDNSASFLATQKPPFGEDNESSLGRSRARLPFPIQIAHPYLNWQPRWHFSEFHVIGEIWGHFSPVLLWHHFLLISLGRQSRPTWSPRVIPYVLFFFSLAVLTFSLFLFACQITAPLRRCSLRWTRPWAAVCWMRLSSFPSRGGIRSVACSYFTAAVSYLWESGTKSSKSPWCAATSISPESEYCILSDMHSVDMQHFINVLKIKKSLFIPHVF